MDDDTIEGGWAEVWGRAVRKCDVIVMSDKVHDNRLRFRHHRTSLFSPTWLFITTVINAYAPSPTRLCSLSECTLFTRASESRFVPTNMGECQLTRLLSHRSILSGSNFSWEERLDAISIAAATTMAKW